MPTTSIPVFFWVYAILSTTLAAYLYLRVRAHGGGKVTDLVGGGAIFALVATYGAIQGSVIIGVLMGASGASTWIIGNTSSQWQMDRLSGWVNRQQGRPK